MFPGTSHTTVAAPVPAKEKERQKELLSLGLLDTTPEKEFNALTRICRKLCETPVSVINLLDEERQWSKAVSGVSRDTLTMPRNKSVCQYTIHKKEIMEIPDLTKDDRFKNAWYVAGEPYFRFYAGAPLITTNGYCVGSLCVLDRKPRTLTAEQLDFLDIIADEVVIRLEQSRREQTLKELNKFKDELVQIVSHDIRNPLTVIAGATDFLMEDIDQEERLELLELIRESSDQIQGIVFEMLDSDLTMFSDLKLNPREYQPADGIEELAGIFSFAAKKKKIQVCTEYFSSIPTVKLDRQKYNQIVSNLISNAIKFTPAEGKVTLRIDYDADEQKLVTVVQDSGIGIPNNILEVLFEQDRGKNRAGTDNEPSFGIGLLIVKKLCDLCNAEIKVESENKKGTIFTVAFPAPSVI